MEYVKGANTKMRKLFVCFLVILQLVSLFSTNIFAYTVDDIRDLVGKERVDDTFTQYEIDVVIQQYEQIERENLIVEMFDIGKEIDINSELIEEYNRLEGELQLAIDELANNFEGGKPFADVLASKSKVESILHRIDALRDIGFDVEVEYIPNVWTEKYEEVQEVVKQMNSFYDIGSVGEEMNVPYIGLFEIYSPFGPRLNKFTYDSVEVHNGIDFDIPIGTTVIAQWSGVVSKIYTTENGGKMVEISHGENLKTVYGHLGNIIVSVGDRVNQYDGIGMTGKTGKMAQPHLHFEVILDGEYINPIYLYGTKGVMAFKEYASTYTSRNLEAQQIANEVKKRPTKETVEKEEVIEDSIIFDVNIELEGFDDDSFFENSMTDFSAMGEDNNSKSAKDESDKINVQESVNMEDNSDVSNKSE